MHDLEAYYYIYSPHAVKEKVTPDVTVWKFCKS